MMTDPQPPIALPLQFDNIPVELAERRQWVFWKFVWKPDDEKFDKPPFGAGSGWKPDGGGITARLVHAKATDQRTWLSLRAAASSSADLGCNGVGYVTSKADPFTVIDLDGCIDDAGQISEWAQTILDLFSNTYAEKSPSGKGVRIVVRGKLPIVGSGKKKTLPGDHCGFEAAHDSKYFTITGHVLPGRPSATADLQEELTAWFRREWKEEPKANGHSNGHTTSHACFRLPDDDTILSRAAAADNGLKFNALFAGDRSAYDGDDSAADLALCDMLAFWCARDRNRIDGLFRRSHLYRDKWDEARAETTYGWMTIDKAIASIVEVFNWSGKSSAPPITINDQFSLQPLNERRTPSGKVTVQTKIIQGENSVSVLDVSSAASSQARAVKTLAKVTAVLPADLEVVIGKLLVEAAERLDEPKIDSDDQVPTIREIVGKRAPEVFDLRYRTADGKAWSEKYGRPISRAEFVTHLPESLMDAAVDGRDAPVNDETGYVDEVKLSKLVQTALAISWSSTVERLPMQAADAAKDMGPNSAAAKKFAADIFRVWTSPSLFKSVPVGDGSDNAPTRASLASMVEELFKPFKEGRPLKGGGRQRWFQIKTAVSAWWRPGVADDGRIVPRLAMRYDLFDNIGIRSEWATDQQALGDIGRQWGVFTDATDAKGRLTDGTRLAVLSVKMTDRILSHPTEDTEDDIEEMEHDDKETEQCASTDAADATDSEASVSEGKLHEVVK
jgi:primase-polymerase (primpol)-like protein